MGDRMRRVERVRAAGAVRGGAELKDPRIGFVTVTGVGRRPISATRRSSSACSATSASARRRSPGWRRRTACCRPASRAAENEADPAADLRVRSDGRARRPHDPADRRARARRRADDPEAVADALREHDRFLSCHAREPRRGRARLAARGEARAARARQGHRDVPLRRRAAAARVRVHGARRRRPRAARRRGRAGAARRRLRERRRGSGRISSIVERAPLTIDIDHHHDNTRFGDVNLIVADASSTGEVLRDVFAELGVELTPELAEPLYIALVTDTGRFQYANTTPKALRLAAELVEAGADIHRVFQSVYESVEFAKFKLLARALERAEVLEGGRLVVSHLVRSDFAEVGAAEAVRRGHHRPPARGRRSRAGGADPRAAAQRRRAGAQGQPARADRRARRLRDRAQVGGGGHRQAAGFSSDASVEEITDFIQRERSLAQRAPPRALEPGRRRRSSTSRRGRRRSRSSPISPPDRRPRPATPARSIRSRPGCCSCCPARQLSSLHASSASTSATSPTSTSPAGQSTGDPRGRGHGARASRPRPTELERRLEGLRGEIELPIPAALGGEDRR